MHIRLFAAGILLPAAFLGAQAPPVAAVLERPTSWTQGWGGTARLLQDAGFAVKALDPGAGAQAAGADAIVLGTFCAESAEYQAFLKAHGATLAPFVAAGGVVLQLTQADQTEPRVPFLPPGMAVERCDEDLTPILVHEPSHPLLQDLPLTRGELKLSTLFGRQGNWECLAGFLGLRVLMGADRWHRRPVLLEGQHGAGRFLVASLYLDSVCDAGGKPAAPADWLKAAGAFFAGFRRYVDLVRQGKAPPVAPTPPYQDPPALAFVPGSFTLAVLPDTQLYCESWPHHLEAQTRWLAGHARTHDIKYVLQLGDVTNRNTRDQWTAARKAFALLDGVVPYAIALGNHDLGPGGGTADRSTYAHEYFKPDEIGRWPTCGGFMEPGRLDNSYHTFGAGGEEFLVLALEFGPRDRTVAWAREVAGRHPDHRVILVTHAFLYYDDTRYDWHRYGASQSWSPRAYPVAASPEGLNDGEELFQRLLAGHPGALLALGGHVLGDGLARLESRGVWGNTVHQMLVNYQMHAEGGQGFMRLIEFLPGGRTVQVRCWSPSLQKFRTDPDNQFTFALVPPLAGGGR